MNELKQYLHVERKIEKDLEKLIKSAYESKKQQLILVCGNVGDGKSHVLSKLNEQIANKFSIHNDATESFNPKESFSSTLDELLQNFSARKLGQYNDKIIVAINLGTLNNFLDSHGEKYPELKAYVEKKGILVSDNIQDNKFDNNSCFQFVNFSDYQIYELGNNGVDSEVISALFEKVFSSSGKNPIYEAFNTFKSSSTNLNNPIFYNYEFLSDDKNRSLVVQLIIQAIIKSKQIISITSLLTFIHDLVMPIGGSESFGSKKAYSPEEYCKAIIPNKIFDHPELSLLFKVLSHEDPCLIHSEKVDDSIVLVINLSLIHI